MNQRELYFFLKFASKEGFLNKLRGLGTNPEILNYAEGLEEKYLGTVVGAVIKNRGISLNEIQELVAAKERVEKLKSKDKESIESQLPSDLDPNIKNWSITQIKKGKKDLLLNNLNQIIKFVKEYEIDLASYDVESLLREMGRITEFGNNKDEVNNYLVKVVEYANRKFAEINNPVLISWAKRKLLNIIKELEVNIRKNINETVSFQDLLADAHQIKENMDAGMYRGQEIPHTPLRHREYDALVSNIEFLDDWHKALSPDLSSKSIDDAIKESNEWHNDVANSGLGLQYTPINRSDIVFGPEGWQDPENNGHIILELKNENDLKVEGSKQNHCVGGYGEKIKSNECRIFSLRNVNNIYQPILTIETDMSGAIVRQDYGPKNSRIEKKYHDMVTEWSSQNASDISKLDIHDKIKLAKSSKNQNILAELAKDDNRYVREGVAQNSNTNEKTLEELALAKNSDDYLKSLLTRNPNTNERTLELLVQNESINLKINVAEHPNTNEKTLELLAQEKEALIRQYVAQHLNTNEKTLELLAQDKDESTKWNVIGNPNADGKILKYFDLNMRSQIAQRNSTSTKILESLAKDESSNEFIRIYIAQNWNSNENTLEFLAKDVLPIVRIVVTTNHKTSDKILEMLAKDKDLSVRQRANKYLVERRLKQASYNSKINKLSHAVNLFYKTIKAISKF